MGHTSLLLSAAGTLAIATLLAPAAAVAADPPIQPTWAQCWVDGATLACTRPAETPSALTTSVMLDIVDHTGSSLGMPTLAADGSVQTVAIPDGAYPLEVRVVAMFSWSSEVASGVLPTALHAELPVGDPSSYPVSAPLVLRQPFALWRVGLTAQGTTAVLRSTGASISVAPFANGYGAGQGSDATLSVGGGVVATDGTTAHRYVIAPVGAALEATVTLYDPTNGSQQNVSFTLAGPGDYVAASGTVTAAP